MAKRRTYRTTTKVRSIRRKNKKGIEERNLEIKIELERETFTIGTETATSLLNHPLLPTRSLYESRLGNLNYAVFKVRSQGNP